MPSPPTSSAFHACLIIILRSKHASLSRRGLRRPHRRTSTATAHRRQHSFSLSLQDNVVMILPAPSLLSGLSPPSGPQGQQRFRTPQGSLARLRETHGTGAPSHAARVPSGRRKQQGARRRATQPIVGGGPLPQLGRLLLLSRARSGDGVEVPLSLADGAGSTLVGARGAGSEGRRALGAESAVRRRVTWMTAMV